MDKVIKRKVILPIAVIVLLILICIILSIAKSGTFVDDIVSSFFPVWIFLSVIISHNGYTFYISDKAKNETELRNQKIEISIASKASIFFLLIQNLMSNISLFGVIQHSNRKSFLIAITILSIFGEAKCIKLLYKNMRKY